MGTYQRIALKKQLQQFQLIKGLQHLVFNQFYLVSNRYFEKIISLVSLENKGTYTQRYIQLKGKAPVFTGGKIGITA